MENPCRKSISAAMSAYLDLQNQIHAVETSLRALRTSACFDSAAATQAAALTANLVDASLTRVQIVDLCTLIQACGFPATHEMNLLTGQWTLQAIETSPGTRKPQQNYEAQLKYYKATQWSFMLNAANSVNDKLDMLLQQPLDLNIRNASEPTAQLLTLVYLLITQGQEKVQAMDGYMKLEHLKYVKKVLKRKNSVLRQPVDEQVVTLPNTVNGFSTRFPIIWARVFHNEGPGICPFPEDQVRAMASEIPMRSRRNYQTMMTGYAQARPVGSNAMFQQMQLMQRQLLTLCNGNQQANDRAGDFNIEILSPGSGIVAASPSAIVAASPVADPRFPPTEAVVRVASPLGRPLPPNEAPAPAASPHGRTIHPSEVPAAVASPLGLASETPSLSPVSSPDTIAGGGVAEIESVLAARILQRNRVTFCRESNGDNDDIEDVLLASIGKRNVKRKISARLRAKTKKQAKLRAALVAATLAAEDAKGADAAPKGHGAAHAKGADAAPEGHGDKGPLPVAGINRKRIWKKTSPEDAASPPAIGNKKPQTKKKDCGTNAGKGDLAVAGR